ncbi:MAG: hypothetical protein IKB87_04890 [Clostridia bacterium]|nr:hypothetical protein [Clostridia bacterium]
MALDKKKSVYEIAIEIGGRIDQSLGRTVGQTKKEMDGLEGSFAKMNKTVSGLKNFIGGSLIVAGGTFLINKLKNVAGSAIDAASEMETYRATLNTVLKDEKRAGEMMAWATDFAAHTPFSTGDIVDAVTRLEAYGFKSQTMMENIGNMASAMNKDLPTAVEAVYKATLGEMELMENNFAITKKLIKEKSQEWYGQAAVNASGAIANAELYNNTLLRLIEEKFEGGMERQSKIWAGIKSNMEDSKEAILRKIIGVDNEANALEDGAYAKFLSFMGGVSEKMSELVDSDTVEAWAEVTSNVTEEYLPKIEKFITEDLPPLAKSLGEAAKAGVDLAASVEQFVRALTGGQGVLGVTADLATSTANSITGTTNALTELTEGKVGAKEWYVKTEAAILGEDNMLSAIRRGWKQTNDFLNSFFVDSSIYGYVRKDLGGAISRWSQGNVITGDIVVSVTTQPGDDANAIGRTVGERVREAIAEAQHQNNRTRFTPQLAK